MLVNPVMFMIGNVQRLSNLDWNSVIIMCRISA